MIGSTLRTWCVEIGIAFCLSALGISASSLVGQWFYQSKDSVLAMWVRRMGGNVDMAVPTALCIILLDISLLIVLEKQRRRQ